MLDNVHERDCMCVCAHVLSVHVVIAGICVCGYVCSHIFCRVQEPTEIYVRYVPFPTTPKGERHLRKQNHTIINI